MPAYKGSLVLVKVGNGAIPEIFSTIGGLRVTGMELNNGIIDASNKELGIWRKLLGNAGQRSIRIRCSGIFTDNATEETVRECAFASSVNNYQFIYASGDYFTGAFQITSYERGADLDEEEKYRISLESAGNIVFTAV